MLHGKENLVAATNPGNSHFGQKLNIYLASDWLRKSLKSVAPPHCTAVAYFSILISEADFVIKASKVQKKHIYSHLKTKLENCKVEM